MELHLMRPNKKILTIILKLYYIYLEKYSSISYAYCVLRAARHVLTPKFEQMFPTLMLVKLYSTYNELLTTIHFVKRTKQGFYDMDLCTKWNIRLCINYTLLRTC